MTSWVREVEALFLTARGARDAADVADGRGIPESAAAQAGLAADADVAEVRLRAALAVAPDRDGLPPDDAAAIAQMERALATGLGLQPSKTESDPRDEVAEATTRLTAAYTAASGSLRFGGEPIGRLSILGRLGTEADRARRRALFLALEPLWRAVDGDGREASPYRELLARMTAAGTPRRAAANEDALGLEPAEIEGWCVSILEAWRDV